MSFRPRLRSAAIALACAGLCACASVSDQGRSRYVAPRDLAAAYSDFELQTLLALARDGECRGRDCDAAAAFTRQVQRIGARLVAAARAADEGGRELPEFSFIVPPKSELGTLSSSAGTVVVFDGVRELRLDEPALAFLVAREMGHILAQHHEEDSATSFIVSAVASLAMPVLNLLRGAMAAVPSVLASTSAATTVATTAASMASSRIVKSFYRADQKREADLVALQLMHRAGWPADETDDALTTVAKRLPNEGWAGELLASKIRLDQLTMGPPLLPGGADVAVPARVAAASF